MSTLNWQLTATTVYCESVGDEATLLVYKDGSAKCIAYKRYCANSGGLARGLKCEGPECPRLVQYRDELLKEGTEG